MKSYFLLFAMVITIFISSVFCFGSEKKDHICFRVIDADKDGKVTFQEFAKVFGDDKEKFAATDLNGDGRITHDEYHQSLGHGAS